MKKGFTLSEVLIALGIIGVVAGLTIPTLMTNYNNKVFMSSLKRVSSEIDLAAKQVIADEESNSDNFEMPNLDHETGQVITDSSGNPELITPDAESGFYSTKAGMSTSDENQGAQYFLNNYFKHTEVDCRETCTAASYKGGPSGVEIGSVPESYYCIKLNSGSSVCMAYDNNAMNVIVDVNGRKSPNTVGRDLYVMRITNNGGFEDISSDVDHCNSAGGEEDTIVQYASGCLAKVIKDGWTIRD